MFRDWKQERKYMIYTPTQVSLLEATQNTQMCNWLTKHNKCCIDGEWHLPCNKTRCTKRKL